jgi:hypothetical protein
MRPVIHRSFNHHRTFQSSTVHSRPFTVHGSVSSFVQCIRNFIPLRSSSYVISSFVQPFTIRFSRSSFIAFIHHSFSHLSFIPASHCTLSSRSARFFIESALRTTPWSRLCWGLPAGSAARKGFRDSPPHRAGFWTASCSRCLARSQCFPANHCRIDLVPGRLTRPPQAHRGLDPSTHG